MSKTQKWKKLEYHGPALTQYKRLPSNVKLHYNHQPIQERLSDDAEEAIVNYAAFILSNNKNIRNQAFKRNFFEVCTRNNQNIAIIFIICYIFKILGFSKTSQ